MQKLLNISLAGIIILSLGLSACGTKKYSPKEYISATGVASPGTETKVKLEDGAGIVIPADSIEQQVNVTVERNPEKSKSLPPLPDNVSPVGDFYNFDISGGELVGFVDLVMPFDPRAIPEGEGILSVAYPAADGWEYVPAVLEGNQVVIYTDHVGDPIIAWHFFSDDASWKAEMAKKKRFCDPTIALNVIPESGARGEARQIVGKIMPINERYVDRLSDQIASFFLGKDVNTYTAGVDFEITVNGNPARPIRGTTNADGSFQVDFNPDEGFKDGNNTLKISAQCDSVFRDYKTASTGDAKLSITPAVANTDVSPTAIPSQPATIVPTPTGAVLIPDFTGKPFTEAADWLKSNGFKYTWIDGSSSYDLGMVYKQAPAGGQYKVPHRTTVVLYRTNEVKKIPLECEQQNLTEEECANAGIHEYSINEILVDSYLNPHQTHTYCTPESGNDILETVFNDGTVDWWDNDNNSHIDSARFFL